MQAEDYRKVPEVGVTNPTIDVLRAHRTIRKFEDSPLSVQDRDALIDVARRAPTSSFRQQFSIIHVTDVALRDQLAEVAQQPYVGTSKGDLFMFVVDLYRNARIREEAGLDIAPLQRTNLFLAAMEDAVLAAHNMEVAAESMGLGTVYLGSLLRGPQRTIELLKLPRMTFPILGLLVGARFKIPRTGLVCPSTLLFPRTPTRWSKVPTSRSLPSTTKMCAHTTNCVRLAWVRPMPLLSRLASRWACQIPSTPRRSLRFCTLRGCA